MMPKTKTVQYVFGIAGGKENKHWFTEQTISVF